jgi:hypothetical protein
MSTTRSALTRTGRPSSWKAPQAVFDPKDGSTLNRHSGIPPQQSWLSAFHPFENPLGSVKFIGELSTYAYRLRPWLYGIEMH